MADIQQDVTAAKAAVKTDVAAVESDVVKVEADAKGVIARLDAWIGAHRKAGIAIAAALFAAAFAIIVHLV